MYIDRDIEGILLDAAKSFQVITIYGSRQVGKSTTVDHLFGDSFETVSLDDAEDLDLALSNPKAFLESHPWPLIIDEVQKAVGLLSEVKRNVDRQRRIWMKNNETSHIWQMLPNVSSRRPSCTSWIQAFVPISANGQMPG